MAMFSSDHDGFDLRDEVAALRRELASLSRQATKQGRRSAGHARDGAADLFGEIANGFIAALPAMRASVGQPARRVERAVRAHPERAVAVAGLATLALAAAFIWGSRK